MPLLLAVPLAAVATGVGFKLAGSGADDIADNAVKIALVAGATLVTLKYLKVI